MYDNFCHNLGTNKCTNQEVVMKIHSQPALEYNPDENFAQDVQHKNEETTKAHQFSPDKRKLQMYDSDSYREGKLMGDAHPGPSTQCSGTSTYHASHSEQEIHRRMRRSSYGPFADRIPRFITQTFYSAYLAYQESSRKRRRRVQDPPVEHNLQVALEEINMGVIRRVLITRKVLQDDGSTRKANQLVRIKINPGCEAGTTKTLLRGGDQKPDTIPADIVFIIKDKPHALFKRCGSDICYVAKISLKQALCGCSIEVPTLSGEKISLDFGDEIVTPQTVKRLTGQGLPLHSDPSRRGDIIVRFEIGFLDRPTQSLRDVLSQQLP